MPVRTLAAITFVGGLAGSVLLVLTPSRAFDVIIPLAAIGRAGRHAVRQGASEWLHERVTIGRPTLMTAQSLLAVYGGYFGGGVGLMLTATYGLLAGADPRSLFAVRTLMLAIANLAAYVGVYRGRPGALVGVPADVAGARSLADGWGAKFGKRLASAAGAGLDAGGHRRDDPRLFHPGLRLKAGARPFAGTRGAWQSVREAKRRLQPACPLIGRFIDQILPVGSITLDLQSDGSSETTGRGGGKQGNGGGCMTSRAALGAVPQPAASRSASCIWMAA